MFTRTPLCLLRTRSVVNRIARRPYLDNTTTPQTSPYDRVDPEERAYQKLEKAYTAKTELAAGLAAAAAEPGGSRSKGKRAAQAAAAAAAEGGAVEEGGTRKKSKAGRWFD